MVSVNRFFRTCITGATGGVLLFAILAAMEPASALAQSSKALPPDACQQGFVWREAFAGDHVCVTPQRRTSVAEENAAAAQNLTGSRGRCVPGYVWRLAAPQDDVCVTQQARRDALRDNGLAASRLASFVRAPPQTPFIKMRVPYPPAKPGCRHLEGGEWRDVPCATEKDFREHPLLPPAPENTIHSQEKTIAGKFGRTVQYTIPFVWASVSVQFLSDPTQAQEYDQAKSSSTQVGNSFSIQANTNFFPCGTCSDGYPLPSSKPGDQGWVQFVFQNPAASAVMFLCIWQNDFTQQDYSKTCLPLPPPNQTLPLTGAGAPWAQAEIVGFITCPAPGSNSNCILSIVAYAPWTGVETGWYGIMVPDVFGLAGNWTDISGGILGYGGSSTAIFANATLQTELQAYACYVGASSVPGEPGYCAATGAQTNPEFEPAAIAEMTNVTGESSNLLPNGPITFSCPAYTYGCYLVYNSIAPINKKTAH